MSGAPVDIIVQPSGTQTIHTLPASNPAGTSDTVALPFQGVNGGVPLPIISLSSGSITNPVATFARPANTTAYAVGNLIANSTTAGLIAVPSFSILTTAGGAIIPRIRVLTNVSTGWNGVNLSINLWSASPTYTNGDGGAYAPSGSANWLANYQVTLTQFGDGAAGGGGITSANEMTIKLASGYLIFADIQTLSVATPISGQTFTIAAELMN